MKIECMVLGAVATNCYFVINEETKETIVIDPADRADAILKKAAEEGLTLKAVFLTHGHGDHIMAVPELREKTGIPVYACRAEEELLADPGQNLSPKRRRPPGPHAAAGRHPLPPISVCCSGTCSKGTAGNPLPPSRDTCPWKYRSFPKLLRHAPPRTGAPPAPCTHGY